MSRIIFFLTLFLVFSMQLFAGENHFEKLQFLIGEWQGAGAGFGSESSKITATFKLVMDGRYIEVRNESFASPTEKNPKGDHHIDHGFISYDNIRQRIVFRQFNMEGYVNRYILNDSLSNADSLVFETEAIENFMPGGSAKWTIKKQGDQQYESAFFVKFPGKGASCFGRNLLSKVN